MQRKELEGLSREELIVRAEAAGVSRPRSLTAAELQDELVLRGTAKPEERARGRGWFGRARDLLKSAIERGLDLPEAAPRATRGPSRSWPPAPPPPLPTVTLAEIYAAQGHLERAVQVLGEVLTKEPSHGEAARLRADYQARILRTVVRPDLAEDTTMAAEATAGDTGGGAPASQAPLPAALAAGAESDASSSVEGSFATEDELEIDEVVAVAVDPSTIYLYWEVRPETAARARVDAPDGALIVRTVTVSAAPDGPLEEVRDERVDALSGELFVRGLRDGAHARVSVGWRSNSGFVPLAVAAEVTTPRRSMSEAVATELAAWSPPAGLAPRGRWVGAANTETTPSHPGAAGAPPARGAAPDAPAARRTALLRPAEVFQVPGGAQVPIGTWQPPGSSELLTLYGTSPGSLGSRRGGASDLVLGGASDQLLPLR